MSDIDDVPLVRTGDTTSILAPPSPPAKARATPIAIVAVAGLAIGAAGAWWWARQMTPPAKPAAAASGTEAAVKPDADSMRPLPALDQMDTFLRALFGPLSSSPE